MNVNYREYLESDHWQQTRRKRLQIDGYKCVICGSQKALNVHHLTYKRLGHENVKRDLITLCHCCHAALHRIKEMTKQEAERLKKSTFKIVAYIRLRKKVTELLIAEIWIRDKANGGDQSIFERGQIERLCAITRIIYPHIRPARKRIKKALLTMRDVKVIEVYQKTKSSKKTAQAMNMDSVLDILAARGFGKIK